MGLNLAKFLSAPLLDEVNNRFQSNENITRQKLERIEQILNSIKLRLYPTSVIDGDDGRKEKVINDVSFQTIVFHFASIAVAETPLEQLHDKIDNLNKLIRTYVMDSKLADHDRELLEIVNMLASNSVSAEKFARLERRVKQMAACCLPPETVKELMNEWQLMRAIHQRRVELDTETSSGCASIYAASSSDVSTYSTAPSDSYYSTSDAPPPIPMRTKVRDPTTSVEQVDIKQLPNSKHMSAEAASNCDAVAYLTKQLAQSVGKIITTMLQNAKREKAAVKLERGSSCNDHSAGSSDMSDYESLDNIDFESMAHGNQRGIYVQLDTIPDQFHNYTELIESLRKDKAELVFKQNPNDNIYS